MCNHELTCKYRSRSVFFLRILIINLLIWGVFVGGLYIWGHSSFHDSLIAVFSKIIDFPQETIVQHLYVVDKEELLSSLMGFYETVITILSIFLAIISLVGFLYVRAISKEEVREIAEETLKEAKETSKKVAEELGKLDEVISKKIQAHTRGKFFEAYLNERLREILQQEYNHGQLGEIINTVEDLEEGIERLKRNILSVQNLVEKTGTKTSLSTRKQNLKAKKKYYGNN